MPETNDLSGVPQFQTAEFYQQPSGDACCICRNPLVGSYYRINGSMACPACSEQVRAQKPKDSHAAFTRAILFGLGGALLGLILYSAVGILFHLQIGYISLAVGYLVGKAMMLGSGNIGGRRYQWVAVALTYAAVSLSAVPISVAEYLHSDAHAAYAQKAKAAAIQHGALTAPVPTAQAKKAALSKLGMILGTLVLFGLGSPFLEVAANPIGGAIGILILVVGVRIGWQITGGPPLPTVEGPY